MRLWVFLSLLFLASCGSETESNLNLINGRADNQNLFPETVRIIIGRSACSATIVGPRVILTAAHCGQTGAIATFAINGQRFQARLTRANGFPQIDHDLNLGLVNRDMPVRPASIGGSARVGQEITLVGFGCVNPGGGGGNDGIRRFGNTKIVGFSGFDMVMRGGENAALCFGDSGGSAFVAGTKQLLGVNSKGNIRDTSFDTRTDLQRSRQFFQTFARANNVIICGVNSQC